MAGSWPYNLARWKRLRLLKLARDPLCEHCKAQGFVRAASVVDHVVAINNGGDPWDMRNLMSCCPPCHNTKTRHCEQLGRPVPVKGCDPATGLPFDPSHWWAAQENCSQRDAEGRRAAHGET